MTVAHRIAFFLLILSWTVLADGDGSKKPTGKRLEFELRDIPGGTTVDGRRFEVPLAGRVTVIREDETVQASVTIEADLKSLQAGLPAVMRRRVNRHDECNEVIDVHTITLSPDGSSLRVDAAAHYEDWECPWTEVLGQRINVGKHKLLEQNGSATLILTPETDGTSVSIRVDVRDMKADGVLGNLLRTDLFGPWIRDMILQSLPQMIHLGSIEQQLPAALKGLTIRLANVSFQDRGSDVLGLSVKATIEVKGPTADSAWKLLKEERK